MSNAPPSDDRTPPPVQQAIGSALKQKLQDTAKQPPPEEFMQILAKVDRRSRIAPRR